MATAVRPQQKSVDTHVETPASFPMKGTTYVIRQWADGDWQTIEEFVAGKEPFTATTLPIDALYWMTAKESRRLERVFTIQEGRQRWW